MNSRINCALVIVPLALSAALHAASSAQVISVTTFATGTAIGATGPDSLALGGNYLWVSYTNGAESHGNGGSSTVVQYDLLGNVVNQYTVAGSVDGLKIDATGVVWCLQNQDGNSTLTQIVPGVGITPGSPYPYAVQSAVRGYDDAAFRGSEVFLSYTNPVNPTDPTIQKLTSGVANPLTVTPILTMGAKGRNIVTGQRNQPTTQNDPDSLKLTPTGDLMLTSGDDGQLIIVSLPGTPLQSVSFISLLDQKGNPVSSLDDALFLVNTRGTVFLADTGNNRVLAIEMNQIPFNSLYASVGSLNVFGNVDLRTGEVTPLVSNLKGPHGLVFLSKDF